MSIKHVRKIDSLRRITIPKIYCDALDIRAGEKLVISKSDNALILGKEKVACSLCENEEFVHKFRRGYICRKCLSELKHSPNETQKKP